MSTESPIIRTWKLLYGFSVNHIREMFLAEFEKSFGIPWTDTEQNRAQFRTTFSNGNQPLFWSDELTVMFDTLVCIDWDLPLVCAMLEHLFVGRTELKAALVDIHELSNEFSYAFAINATIQPKKATEIEKKLKKVLCFFNADGDAFDRYANRTLTKETATEFRLDVKMQKLCEELLAAATAEGGAPPRVLNFCTMGLAFAGLITPRLEARMRSLVAQALEAQGDRSGARSETARAEALRDLTGLRLREAMRSTGSETVDECARLQRQVADLKGAKRDRVLAELWTRVRRLYQDNQEEVLVSSSLASLSFGCLHFPPLSTDLLLDKAMLPVPTKRSELERLPKPRSFFHLGLEALRNDDFAAAKKWFLKGSDLGDAESSQHLSVMYANGFGIERSMPKAIERAHRTILLPDDDTPGWRDAVGQAHAMMATLSDVTSTVDDDVQTAMKHLSEAARLNTPVAFQMLGIAYQVGFLKLEPDLAAARDYLQFAIPNGPAESRFHLGHVYFALGDYERAKRWFQLARDGGFSTALLDVFVTQASLPARSTDESKAASATSTTTSSNENGAHHCDVFVDRNWVPRMAELQALPRSPLTKRWCATKQLAADLLERKSSDAETRRRVLATILQHSLTAVLSFEETMCICLVAKTCCLNADEAAAADVPVHVEHRAAVFDKSLHHCSVDEKICKMLAFLEQHPGSIVALTYVGRLQLLGSNGRERPEGVRKLVTALDMLDSLDDPSHPLFDPPVRAALQMDVLLTLAHDFLAETEASDILRAEKWALRFLSLAKKYGHHSVVWGHVLALHAASLLQRFDLHHYDAAVAADNAQPAFLRGIVRRRALFREHESFAAHMRESQRGEAAFDGDKEVFNVKCRADAVGGELLGMKGVDARLFSNSNRGLEQLRRELVDCVRKPAKMQSAAAASMLQRLAEQPPSFGPVTSAIYTTIDELVALGAKPMAQMRLLRVVVVSEPFVGPCMTYVLVEDGERSVIRLVVFDHDKEVLAGLGIGSVLNVTTPQYCVDDYGMHCILALQELQAVRVIAQKTICWACLQQKPLNHCGRCQRAAYCSSTCQRTAWQQHGHKYLCKKVKSKKNKK